MLDKSSRTEASVGVMGQQSVGGSLDRGVSAGNDSHCGQ